MNEISFRLKEKRKELGLRVEEVVEKTKLHPSVIHDIEEDNFSNISTAYLRGFVRIYARFLNVDLESFIKDLPGAQTGKKPARKEPPPAAVLPEESPRRPAVSEATKGKPSPMNPPARPAGNIKQYKPKGYGQIIKEKVAALPPEVKKAFIIAVAIVLGLIVLARVLPPIGTKFKAMRQEAVLKAKAKKEQRALKRALAVERKRAAKEKKLKDKTPRAAQRAFAKEPAPEKITVPVSGKTKEIVVSVTTKKSCFIRAVVDGKTAFEGVLRKGVAETWKGVRSIDLKLSDGSAVIVEVNGSAIPSLSTRPRPVKSFKVDRSGITVSK